jgi:hypothetical protein
MKVQFLDRNSKRVSKLLNTAWGKLSYLPLSWQRAIQAVGPSIHKLALIKWNEEGSTPEEMFNLFFGGGRTVRNAIPTHSHINDLVSAFPRLQDLTIDGQLEARDTDALQHLKDLTHLNITISGTLHYTFLQPLRKLKVLSIKGGFISDALSEEIAKHNQSIEELTLICGKSKDSLLHLGRLPVIEKLHLSGEGITDTECQYICQMKALKELSFEHADHITMPSWQQLTNIPTLRTITIIRTWSAEKVATCIRKKRPDLTVTIIDFGCGTCLR